MREALYSRRASGLVRAFRPHDVFIFNTLGFAVGLVVALTPSFLALQQPHAGVIATLTVGFVVCILNGLLYSEVAGQMPRSGGDYVFISRVLSPATGFCSNWGLTWSQLFGLGAYAAWSVSTALAPGLLVLSRTHQLPGLEHVATVLTKAPWAVALAALLILAVSLAISLRGLAFLRRVLQLGFALALLGTLATGIALFTHSPAEARAALDALLRVPTGGGLAVIEAFFHTKANISTTPTSLLSAILALPIGYWAYLGFTYSVYLGGEVAQPRRAQFIGIVGSLIFGYLAYVLLLGRYYELFGRDTIAAFAFAEKNDPSLLPVGSAFLLAVGAVLGRGIGAWLGVTSFFLWYFLLLIVMAQVCVRNIFAWSLDGITPSRLAEVSTRRAVPKNAIVVVTSIGMTFAVLVAYGLINFVNYVALFVTCYLIAGIAAVSLPWRRPDLLATGKPGPGFHRTRMIGLGLANIVVFTIVLAAALFFPDFSGVPATIWPLVCLVVVYGIGLLVFYLARRRTPDLDRELLVTLPPE